MQKPGEGDAEMSSETMSGKPTEATGPPGPDYEAGQLDHPRHRPPEVEEQLCKRTDMSLDERIRAELRESALGFGFCEAEGVLVGRGRRPRCRDSNQLTLSP